MDYDFKDIYNVRAERALLMQSLHERPLFIAQSPRAPQLYVMCVKVMYSHHSHKWILNTWQILRVSKT